MYVYSLILLGLFKLILAFSPFCFQAIGSSLLSLFWIPFLDSLSISFSFIWTYVFLNFSFICTVFLSPFIIYYYYFLTYCVGGLLFLGFRVELVLHFGLCPHKVCPLVCVRFMYGVICACVLVEEGKVCLFVFFWWAWLSEVAILYAECWVCIFIFFVVWMRRPAQGDAQSCI